MKTRFLKIRVYTDSIMKANINIPINLLKASAKFPRLALNMIPREAIEDMTRYGINLYEINMGELLHMVEKGRLQEKIIDMEVLDPVDGHIYVKAYIDEN
jgi:hypothetical protein